MDLLIYTATVGLMLYIIVSVVALLAIAWKVWKNR